MLLVRGAGVTGGVSGIWFSEPAWLWEALQAVLVPGRERGVFEGAVIS